MNVLPTEERARKLWNNKTALIFMDDYLTKQQDEMFNRLGKMLGVYWTIEDIEAITNDAKGTESREKPTDLFYPLSCIIEPKMPEILKKSAGSKFGIDPPKWAKQGEFEDMYDWGPQQFLKFVGGVVEGKSPTGNKAM